MDTRLADLQSALAEVREVVDGARFPLDLDGAPEARERAAALVSQLDDYLAPRLRQLDAPVLAVVGGSTGAGKSTLVNSLVRAPVSPAGVLRPTTRAPMLLAHPSDLPWFVRPDRLPGLPRAARVGSAQPVLQIVSAPLLRPGLALIDAPDFDSVVAANRALARELLAAADLWLFVTTAARYADAAPWQALRDARDRGVGVAIVVDRLPPESADRIIAHFGGMLAEQGLARAPLFAVRESTLDGHGMVPEAEVAPVKQWLDGVAGSTNRRDELTRRTLLGALEATGPRLEALARAAEDQSAATAALAGTVRSSYATAMTDVQARVRSGAVLRGDVYAAWRELVAGGELRQAIDTAAGRRRARPQTRSARPASAGASRVRSPPPSPRWSPRPTCSPRSAAIGPGARTRPGGRCSPPIPRWVARGPASATPPTTWCTAGRPPCANWPGRCPRPRASPCSPRSPRWHRRSTTSPVRAAMRSRCGTRCASPARAPSATGCGRSSCSGWAICSRRRWPATSNRYWPTGATRDSRSGCARPAAACCWRGPGWPGRPAVPSAP